MLSLRKLDKNIVLAPYTTYKIGGPADFFLEVRTKDELTEAVLFARREELSFFILGTGANILVGDKGFRGLVIRNGASHFHFDGESLIAESGATIAELIDACVEKKLSGLEHFVGIPSSVGGALRQNLHFLAPDRTRTLFIGPLVKSAVILDEKDTIRTVSNDFFEFGYDDSILHYKDITVLEATFTLVRTNSDEMKKRIEKNLTWRLEKQPQLDKFPSCGSVFQKIEGVGAGRLIDGVGFKGRQVGGAMISDKHANYIVNTGTATAQDIIALIELIQEEVRKKTGYALKPEIGFVGEF